MDAKRLFLLANAVAWLPYGLYLVFQPGFLREAAGVAASSPTGTTELRAMYGGLQAAIGVLALRALGRPDLERATIAAIATLAAGLFSGRLIGFLVDGGASAYTIGGLAFEATLAVLGSRLLRRHGDAPAGG